MAAGEFEGAGGERGYLFVGVHGGEAVAAQDCEAGGGDAGLGAARHSGATAHVEPELIAYNEAAAADALDVAPIPVALFFRDGDEGLVGGAVPVEAVAAE